MYCLTAGYMGCIIFQKEKHYMAVNDLINVLVIGEPARAIQELTREAVDALRPQFPGCDFRFADIDSAEELREGAEWAEVIVGRMPPALLKNAKNLKWMHLQSAGVNGYESRTLYPSENVTLTRSAGVFSIPMAEHAIAMLLALNRRLPRLMRQAAAHEWQRIPVAYELYGARVLMVGAGDIAGEIIKRLRGFGCEITALRRDASKPADGCTRVYTDKFEALRDADYIINTLPLTAATENFLGEREFAVMKERAVLINVGRGRTVDTEALIAALREGRIAGAGLDVVEPEPLPATSPLWDMENVIITPHNSGDSFASNARRDACFVENLRRYVAGEPLRYKVDFDAGY